MKRTPLNRSPESTKKFNDRGRRSSARSLNGSKGKPKRKSISPASKAQRALIAENPVCVGCGAAASEWLAIDPAHWWPRGSGGCDDLLCLIGGLCRRFDGSGCHREFDEGRLDLWRLVVTDWPRMKPQFDHATTHATPVQVIERAAGSRIVWEDQLRGLDRQTGLVASSDRYPEKDVVHLVRDRVGGGG